ncbi:PREDICTED: protein sidekick-1-like, partial [Eurypyga helias]|uniref:protein sidekick-1-like n=1 Tax=Eurypyga helias TaxID=54383 RepID=UPI0005283E1C
DVAPYFKTEPGLPQIHLEGNRLVLTCLAEGSWPLEFKWLHNDSEITAYSSEYKYIIPALQRADAGVYQCVVRNRMGALLQRRSEVHVAYMGNFVDANQRKTVTQGQAAVLDVLHILSYPRPQVTWFRDGHKIIPSSRIAITLENQLVILATSVTDAGGYYVQAVNEKNGENKTSPFIHLSVAILDSVGMWRRMWTCPEVMRDCGPLAVSLELAQQGLKGAAAFSTKSGFGTWSVRGQEKEPMSLNWEREKREEVVVERLRL